MKDNNQEQEEIFEIETEEGIDDIEIELEDFEVEGESLQDKIKKLRLALKESKNQIPIRSATFDPHQRNTYAPRA